MLIKRREFLKVGSLAATSLMFPQFLKALEFPETISGNEKILVVLQLSGGNDGLNTIIPTKNDIYYRERQGISVKNALNFTDEAGINPNFSFFKEFYEHGKFLVLTNLIYSNP